MTNADALITNVASQAIERAKHLPEGMEQRVVIDIRGQYVTPEQQERIIEGIINQSNGTVAVQSIEFKD